MYSDETHSLLDKTIATVTRIINQSEQVSCVNDYYFDLDAEVIFEVVKNELPPMLATLQKMKSDILRG